MLIMILTVCGGSTRRSRSTYLIFTFDLRLKEIRWLVIRLFWGGGVTTSGTILSIPASDLALIKNYDLQRWNKIGWWLDVAEGIIRNKMHWAPHPPEMLIEMVEYWVRNSLQANIKLRDKTFSGNVSVDAIHWVNSVSFPLNNRLNKSPVRHSTDVSTNRTYNEQKVVLKVN